MKKHSYLKNLLKQQGLLLLFTAFLTIYSNTTQSSNNENESYLTRLRARGFSLIPAPQQVELGNADVVIDDSWMLDPKISRDNIAYKRFVEGVAELHYLKLAGQPTAKKIILDIKPGTVKGTDDPALNEQGYRIKVTPGLVEITGNGEAGLYYGVQSFLQLLKRNPAGKTILPECIINDWPSIQLRFVHWDTKHHQKRMEALKRLIDWHAFFKVNMISFEMEDKYEYPTNPLIGAPGAYTKAEMQELTRYALERHIQIVPNIQSPAHMAYVLKHEKYAHLRSDGSNYQSCMCDPEAIKLIFEMYQDMIDATPGVEYFHVSTDEVYYAGICDKCEAPYNDENRSLAWIDFAVKAHDWLADRGRRMIAWVEYPVLTEHVSMLPGDIINGIGGTKSFIKEEQKLGMRQLAYSSTQGAEYLFPNHFTVQNSNRRNSGRLEGNAGTVRTMLADGANPIGTFAAAWDDSGLHEETFHLGWATVTQYGWTPYWPSVEQNVADFMDAFYGQNSPDMTSVYYQLIEGAQFFTGGWDKVTSTERGPGYGNSYGKGIGTRRTDDILKVPDIPQKGTLNIEPTFSGSYGEMITKAHSMKISNDDLIYKLNRYIGQVERNRYNLEVFLSIAYLQRYFINTLITLNNAESLLLRADTLADSGKPAEAVALMVEASNEMESLIKWGNRMWKNVQETWEISRYEKGRSVDGRHFVHVLDDVKDHWADRRPGLDYLIAPFQRLKLPEWRNRLNERINEYAAVHKVPVTGLEEERLED